MIQPIDIQNEISNLPPLQREKFGKSYEGTKVSWDLKYRSGYFLDENSNLVKIFARPKENHNYIDVCMEVDTKSYPELENLEENTIFSVEGEISKADRSEINLKNCSLKFDPIKS